jgi:hypothetical protein
VLSVLLRFTDSDYPFGSFWPLCCLFFFDLQILITPLVSSYSFFFIGKYGKMLENLLLLNGLNSTTMIIRRTYTYLSILYWSNKTNTRPPPAIIVLHCTCITLGGKSNLYALFVNSAALMKPNCACVIIAWCLKDKRGRRGRDLW